MVHTDELQESCHSPLPVNLSGGVLGIAGMLSVKRPKTQVIVPGDYGVLRLDAALPLREAAPGMRRRVLVRWKSGVKPRALHMG